MNDKRDSRWSDFRITACAAAVVVTMLGVIYLRTTHAIEVERTLSDQTFLSCALYGALLTAIGVRIWAGLQKHHHIRWCSIPTIVSCIAAYCGVAYGWTIDGSSVMMDAILHPLFWVGSNIVAVLLYTCAATGFIVIAYGLCRGAIQLKMYLHKRSPIREYEIYRFADGLDSLRVDLRRHPDFRKTCNTLQRELDQKAARDQRTGD